MTTRHTAAITVHVFLLRGTDVLLLRRHNTGWGDGMYSVPAGHVEHGESVTEAAIRETKEECGIHIKKDNLVFAHVIHQQQRTRDMIDRIHFFFTCSSFDGEPTNTEPHACDEVRFVPLSDLPENILPYIKRTLSHIENKTPFSEFIEM